MMSKGMLLARHWESEGNLDRGGYVTVPDHKLDLTPKQKKPPSASSGTYAKSFL
ncbi:MAG: hypothetical protein HKN52_06615 [Eudoraea sp.]|nr:hypothetical protein [Eudoraea sp.]